MTLALGCIADDVTGASDLALLLAQSGAATSLRFSLTADDTSCSRVSDPSGDRDVDAVVYATRIRSLDPDRAAAAARALQRSLSAARQLYWKYCSTFDSNERGNIGPVADALSQVAGPDPIILCPAFPANGRTVYLGHLFVNGIPLAESSMRDHPLTPMHDSNLVRFFGRQTRSGVGLLSFEHIDAGADAIARSLRALRGAGCRYAIADALCARHLAELAAALHDAPLVTGGSALGGALVAEAVRRGTIAPRRLDAIAPVSARSRGVALLAGSCSVATRAQVEYASSRLPTLRVNPGDAVDEAASVARITRWAGSHAAGPFLIATSADPIEVSAVREVLGPDTPTVVERLFRALAAALHGLGVRNFVVAGGETSGAVAEGLGLQAARVGPQIAPGVPWLLAEPPLDLAIAFKSGNFGAESFFLDALDLLR